MEKINAQIHDYSNNIEDYYVTVTQEQYNALEWFIDRYCGDLEITRFETIIFEDLT